MKYKFWEYDFKNAQINFAYRRLLKESILLVILFLFSLIEIIHYPKGWSIVCLLFSLFAIIGCTLSFLSVYFAHKFKDEDSILKYGKISDIIGCAFCLLTYWLLRVCNYSNGSAFFQALVRTISPFGILVSLYFLIIPLYKLKGNAYRKKFEEAIKNDFSNPEREINTQRTQKSNSTKNKTTEIDPDKVIDVEVRDKK